VSHQRDAQGISTGPDNDACGGLMDRFTKKDEIKLTGTAAR